MGSNFTTKLMKTKWFAQPHQDELNFGLGLETGVVNNYTIIPICAYDEGQGNPAVLETNPENAAFAVAKKPNVFPDSTVEQIFTELTVTLAKGFNTNALLALRFCYMPIMMNFKEDYTPVDELTSLATEDVLELERQATNREAVTDCFGLIS